MTMDNILDDKTIHRIVLDTNEGKLDLTKYAPGTKYWWWYTENAKTRSKVTKKNVFICESTIGEVHISWSGYRGLMIDIVNSFPNNFTDIKTTEKYCCNITPEDVFFSKEECLENVHKELKKEDIKEIKEVIQPQREIWEERLKKWNKELTTTKVENKEDKLIEIEPVVDLLL